MTLYLKGKCNNNVLTFCLLCAVNNKCDLSGKCDHQCSDKGTAGFLELCANCECFRCFDKWVEAAKWMVFSVLSIGRHFYNIKIDLKTQFNHLCPLLRKFVQKEEDSVHFLLVLLPNAALTCVGVRPICGQFLDALTRAQSGVNQSSSSGLMSGKGCLQ